MHTSISTDNLLSENLPEHDHGNNLLKDSTQCVEDKVIRQMANAPGVTTKAVLSEINRNVVTYVSSQRSTAAVKMALWRKTQNKSDPFCPQRFYCTNGYGDSREV